MSVATAVENTVLQDLAKEAHRKFPSDGAKAGDWYEAEVHKALEDEDARDEIIRQLVRDSRGRRIAHVRHDEFRVLKGSRRTHVEGPQARGAKAITECATGLLDWYVYGRKLRDYVGTDLVAIAQQEFEKARGTGRNAMFFRKIADFAGDQLVGDVISEKYAKELMEKCQRAEPLASLNGNGHANGNGKNGNRG